MRPFVSLFQEEIGLSGFALRAARTGGPSQVLDREDSDQDAEIDGFNGARYPECAAYDDLILDLESREPSDKDFHWLIEHETACPSGRHSEEGVETALGLPRGALRKGSPQHGLRPASEVVAELVEDHLQQRRLAKAFELPSP